MTNKEFEMKILVKYTGKGFEIDNENSEKKYKVFSGEIGIVSAMDRADEGYIGVKFTPKSALTYINSDELIPLF